MDEMRGFGFVLKDVSRSYVKRFEERAATLGLTVSQCKVLVFVAIHEGVSQARLSELTEVEPMNLVRILDRMEANGWLERRADPVDRRARQIFLKTKARPVVDTIWSVSDATRGEAFAGIPREQVRLLIGLLKKINDNLGSLEPLPRALPASPDAVPTRTRRLRPVARS